MSSAVERAGCAGEKTVLPIAGHSGYFVTNSGEVWGPRGPRRLFKSAYGYLRVYIQRKNYSVHRLVCEAFHGPPPEEDSPALHRDKNRLNNVASNLYWGL